MCSLSEFLWIPVSLVYFRNEPLNKIAVSRAFHELWKYNNIQSEENDCNRLSEILNELVAENLDSDRKQHLISLQDLDKMRDMCNIILSMKIRN
ncbi:hypothetical protein Glove_35g24 [Diversispora epigaea]|uniref:Uncharacterized protein n=1 Tax=Diversispora epigaea TaxID=1348612 RepID=A0A397JQF3_9GLOM|nr:hypothetical protein Glove_35g24 [Diversispora epigaea]